MITTFCDLSEKEVINCNDGSVVGNVRDIEICTDDCRLIAIYVEKNTGLFSKSEAIRIPWDSIEKIGCDVIIVKIAQCCIKDHEHKERKKLFFSGKD